MPFMQIKHTCWEGHTADLGRTATYKRCYGDQNKIVASGAGGGAWERLGIEGGNMCPDGKEAWEPCLDPGWKYAPR